ncbi:MAG: hypothetical protein MRERV_22c034 [Mycoplasmataceae bacterium RV_VA103A]|nr:MAG: hypothetical protein MRERV_22c034 [Mycoplasmataceae bacterium RV_VA103A]
MRELGNEGVSDSELENKFWPKSWGCFGLWDLVFLENQGFWPPSWW